MEKQNTLTGQTNNITTKLWYLGLKGRLILKAFNYDYTERGMSLVELSKKFGFDIHENTLISYIRKFKEQGLISLTARNVGPTHRRKYYKITKKGALFYDRQ